MKNPDYPVLFSSPYERIKARPSGKDALSLMDSKSPSCLPLRGEDRRGGIAWSGC